MTAPIAAAAVIAVGVGLMPTIGAGAVPGAILLGTADSFAILAGSGITNSGTTTITGDVGTFPTTTQTGFGSVVLTGDNHGGDSVTQGAKTDLGTAYNAAVASGPATPVATELGGLTFTPGIYSSPTLGITGTLTLDGLGDPNAVFIFKATGSTLITASNSVVNAINGAQPCNIFWQVTSSATLGATSTMVGSILASTSITATTGAIVRGRLLAQGGAVTLDTNSITNEACAAIATTTTAPGGTTTTTAPGGTTTTTAPGGTTTTTATGAGPTTTGAGGAPRATAAGAAGSNTPPTLASTGLNGWLAVMGGLLVAFGAFFLGLSRVWGERSNQLNRSS